MTEVRPDPEEVPEATVPGDTGEFHRPASVAYERTWELELLISGAVVFALLQLPSSLDRWYIQASTETAGTTYQVVFLVYYYSKLICYTLIGTFVVHLAARAYWVGLLGLDTVFPHGVRWDQLTHGPITTQVHRERQPSIEILIRRVDRLCGVIFSFAFTIVFLFLFSIISFVVLGSIGLAISILFFDGERYGQIVRILFVLLIGPAVVLPILDRLLEGRIDPASRPGRLMYHGIAILYSLLLSVTYTPVYNVIASNLKKNRMHTAFFLAFGAVLAIFTVKDVFVRQRVLELSGYGYLPDAGRERLIDYRHYADARPEEDDVGLEPSVQSQVIRDPFVRLFIPYSPRYDTDAAERECPGVRPLGGTGIRWVGPNPPLPDSGDVAAVLTCLERLHPVFLDGNPMDLSFSFYTEPETDRRGIVSFIPTAGLSDGEHRLVVLPVQRDDPDHPRIPWEIPFWVTAP